MTDNDLNVRPNETAQKLYSFLKSINDQVMLNVDQRSALERDLKTIENIIEMLNLPNSLTDWQLLWMTIRDADRNFGGYVGNELGQELSRHFETLFLDILDSYSKANNP
ncbi:MAG: hypothetical protein WBW94_12990 [Anaerolineales bacterium]